MAPVQDCSQSTDGEAHTTDALNPLMVLLSVIMGLLACVLLIRGLFRRLSGAATTHPTVSLFLWVVFALFLPLTSYMFSQATKNSDDDHLHSEVILLWMLLGELLRKKLDGVRTINASPPQGVNKQSAWDAVDQIVRIAWIGYLIYTHVDYNGLIMFVILWAFCIIKVVRRVVAVEVAKLSFALGKNPPLIAGYMRQLFDPKKEGEGEEEAATAATHINIEDDSTAPGMHINNAVDATAVMKACKYVILGEDEAKGEVGPHGYSPQLSDAKMVTVGNVWQLAESDDALFGTPPATGANKSHPLKDVCLSVLYKLRITFEEYPLKDLCLSFALYKLLRRRFEDYPSAEAGHPESRKFLLSGLLGDDKVDKVDKDKDKGERVFRVIEDELNFLRDYYFSTIPLMLSNIWFFLLNCVFMPVIPIFCCIVILKTTDVFHQLLDSQSWMKAMKAITIYDLIITLLLIVTLFLLEFAEVVVYMLSNWVVVCLLCNYAKKPSSLKWARVRWVLTTLWRVKTSLKRPKLKFNQHSILEPHCCTLRIFSKLRLRHRYLFLSPMLLRLEMCRRFLGVQSISVPKEVKAAIVKYLIDSGGRCPVQPIGKSVLELNGAVREELLQACESESAAETIIVWHIATCIYEKNPRPLSPSRQQPNDDDTQAKREIAERLANRKIAETLSKYCMYLVALAPELRPGDVAWTETAYNAAVKETKDVIKKELVQKNEHNVAVDREMSMKNPEAVFMLMRNKKAAEKGKMLGDWLTKLPNNEVREGRVWKVLAEMWTEIVVYIAPSDNVKSHAQALARGEFITHIWALLSHGGILRWTDAPPPPADQSPAANKSAPLPADQSPV